MFGMFISCDDELRSRCLWEKRYLGQNVAFRRHERNESPQGSFDLHDMLTSPSGFIKCVDMESLTKNRWLFMTMFDGGS